MLMATSSMLVPTSLVSRLHESAPYLHFLAARKTAVAYDGVFAGSQFSTCASPQGSTYRQQTDPDARDGVRSTFDGDVDVNKFVSSCEGWIGKHHKPQTATSLCTGPCTFSVAHGACMHVRRCRCQKETTHHPTVIPPITHHTPPPK